MLFLCVFRAVKYYFKLEVEFERQVSDTDQQQQRTTARLYIPPVISSAESLNFQYFTATLQNSIESFTSHGPEWNPVDFVVCVFQNFPNTTTKSIPILETMFYRNSLNMSNRNKIQSTKFFQPTYRSTL